MKDNYSNKIKVPLTLYSFNYHYSTKPINKNIQHRPHIVCKHMCENSICLNDNCGFLHPSVCNCDLDGCLYFHPHKYETAEKWVSKYNTYFSLYHSSHKKMIEERK